MAGVSVIGVVAACAPTKAKPAKPTEKKVEQPQTGGNQSSNPGSGSTTAGSKQGSETGGSTNTNPETGSTTNTTKQGSENSGTTNSSGGSTNTNPGSGGENNGSQSGETPDSSNSSTNTNPGTGGENSGSQNGRSTENTKNKELENKKKEIKEKISKLPYLSEADKKSFNDQVDTITDPSKANELDTIFTKAQEKDNEEKVKKEEAEKAKAFEAKKNEAKDAITKLNSLLTSDKENIDAVVKIEEAQKIDQIVKEATDKNNVRKNKFTPTKALPEVFNDHNYLTFEFNTSIETYNKLKNKKLILELEVAGEDGLTYVPSPDSAAVYGEEPNQYYIIGGVQKDGLINVRIGTHSYFDASTNSKKGKYKLTSLYRADDGKKTNLLNESSSEVKITW